MSTIPDTSKSEIVHRKSKIFLYLALILTITFIAFSSSLKNDFTNWDDDLQVVNNSDLKDLKISNIIKIFTNFYAVMYQPVTTLSYAIEYKLFGLNPMPYHLDSLVIHLLNVILVFFFFHSLTGKLNFSAIAALFFGIHPMNVESVAWISARSNCMYAFFFLGGLLSYINYLKKHKSRYLAFTYVLFILSLLSKSAAVVFPLVLILIDYYLNRHEVRDMRHESYLKSQILNLKSHLNKLPFFIIALGFGIIGIFSQKSSGQILGIEASFSLFDRIFLITYTASFYIVKLLIPTGLCALHFYPVKASGMLPVEYYLSAAFIIGIVISIRMLKPSQLKNDIVFGVLFFLITIILVLQIVPIRFSMASERYVYLPYTGLIFVIGSICLKFTEKNKFRAYNLKLITPGLIIVMLITALIFSITTWSRNSIWKNSLTLFSDVIKKNPGYADAYNNRGNAYVSLHNYDKAVNDFNMAVKLNPAYADAYNNRGNAYYDIQKYEDAVNNFNMAIKLKPDFAEAFNNRGNVYSALQRYNEAFKEFDRAIDIKPGYVQAYNNRGRAYHNIQKYEQAIADFNEAIKYDPSISDIYNNRGNTYLALQKFEEAVKDYDMSIKLNPHFIFAYNNRGYAYYILQYFNEALNDFNMAISLKPDYARAFANRGNAYFALQKYDEAIYDWENAIQLNPDYELSLRELINKARNQSSKE